VNEGWSSGPPAPIRVIGKAITWLIARFPASWRLLRRPTERFFDRLAPTWDRRTMTEGRMAPLDAALAEIGVEPERILDLGTGTGAAALRLAERYPAADVTGIDVSEEMVASAGEKLSPDLAERVSFEVADASALRFPYGAFDLVVQVSAPAFFAETARVLAPGGTLIVVSSLGTGTPFHTPVDLLRRGFEEQGLVWVIDGAAGPGTYYVLRKPG
jgi:cyclopropane fatty-acyl-phospholipid synthase-like methyltransferase